jgi:FkbM family methyltransferase
MKVIKKLTRQIIAFFLDCFFETYIGRKLLLCIGARSMDILTEVHYNGHKLFFPTPNGVCKSRAVTFNTKEPETLDWINCIPEGDILWDIGANVGLYSVYAAKARKCYVYAFEPSVFNLELLARSINLNKVSSNVCICPFPLSDDLGSNDMHMSSTDWGGAMSTFGEDYGFDGKTLKEVFRFQTIGLTMVDAVKKLGIPKPDFIKIDVDGIEHLILGAGFELLKSVKSVLVEVNDDFEDLALECQKILKNAGLVLEKKLHSEMFENSESYGRLYNQIWIRP